MYSFLFSVHQHLLVCSQNNSKLWTDLNELSGNVANGPTNMITFWWCSGFWKDFDLPKMRSQRAPIIKQSARLSNLVWLPWMHRGFITTCTQASRAESLPGFQIYQVQKPGSNLPCKKCFLVFSPGRTENLAGFCSSRTGFPHLWRKT